MRHLYRWLFLIGALVLAAAPLSTITARSAAHADRAWVAELEGRLDSLITQRDSTVDPASTEALGRIIEMVEEGLVRARADYRRKEATLRALWRWNGRGPLLLVVAAVLFFLSYRLRRFELYGEW